MINLQNKNIIITGATGGIGNSIVDVLTSLDANILVTGTNEKKLEELKSKNQKIKSIKQDKLYMPAYENLIYIYRQIGEDKKAIKLGEALKKNRLKLLQSFSKEDQLSQGGEAYIFRINVGTFFEDSFSNDWGAQMSIC